MFKGQPKGLFALALANTGERFGYYTMLAVFALFLRENFGFEPGTAGAIYSTFLGLVYLMPLVGGLLADKYGFGKMVTIGIYVMFLGYLLLAVPLGSNTIAMIAMLSALLLISLGTGLFKGNLQVMVGNLYDNPKYAHKRDSAFSLFYMAINIGALFAPTAAVKIKTWAETSLGYSSNDAYHFSFAVACAALIISIAIYYIFRPTFRHVEGGAKAKDKEAIVDTLTPAETKSRVTALFFVFAVVIFFWMAFHQNGLTLTYFAAEYNVTEATGAETMLFDVWNLVLLIIAVYATFSIFQSEKAKGKIISSLIATGILGFLVYRATGSANASCQVDAPIFQQFNPFYVVALTPVSMAIFGALAKKGKEPSAPRKIAYGMLVAALGFAVMAYGSLDLKTPKQQNFDIKSYDAIITADTLAKAQIKAANDTVNFNSEIAEYANEVAELNKLIKSSKNELALKAYKSLEIKDTTAIANLKADLGETRILLDTLANRKSRYIKGIEENESIDSLTKIEIIKTFNQSYALTETALTETCDSIKTQAATELETLKETNKPLRTSSFWLIITYLVLTFAELLLSPMGISFVSKVAPPKYKGLMMGCWFVATAIGNLLVSVGGFLWVGIPLSAVWGVFIALCIISALFMFVMMKKLEAATK